MSVISRHIKNIFAEGELDKESNLHFLQIANADRPVAFYSLDVIISVGYRVKSIVGTRFRQWANKILKDYLVKGPPFPSFSKGGAGVVCKIMSQPLLYS